MAPERKTWVSDVLVYDMADGGKVAQITFFSGKRLEVRLNTPLTETIGGSAANTANALIEFGCQDTGIISAVGRGAGHQAITRSLEARGLTNICFFHRTGGTARSLILYARKDGRIIIIAKKPPYQLRAETLAELKAKIAPRILICSGFVDYELPLIDALYEAEGVRDARVLSPHVSCFDTPHGRQSCLDLATRADLFHCNGSELGRLLTRDEKWKMPDDESALRTLLRTIPSKIVCITQEENGSVAYVRASDCLYRQAAYPAAQVCNKVGAGDVHLVALVWYLWLRGRTISLPAALEVAARICASKITHQRGDGVLPRPWDGIPTSETRKPWVREAEAHYPVP